LQVLIKDVPVEVGVGDAHAGLPESAEAGAALEALPQHQITEVLVERDILGCGVRFAIVKVGVQNNVGKRSVHKVGVHGVRVGGDRQMLGKRVAVRCVDAGTGDRRKRTVGRIAAELRRQIVAGDIDENALRRLRDFNRICGLRREPSLPQYWPPRT